MHRRERIGFKPLISASVAVLPAEVVAPVAQRRERHVPIALRSDKRIEALERNGAVQNPIKNSEMIGNCSYIVMLRVTWRHRLRIEIFRIHEIRMLRAGMQRRGDNLLGRDDVIELRKRINELLLRFVIRKRQSAARISLVVINQRSMKIEPLALNRAAQ